MSPAKGTNPSSRASHRPLDGVADIAAVAVVIGDRTRVAMLDALLDQPDLPASELAGRVGVSASTASAHLIRLVETGLVTVERHGRQRRYRLTGPAVATALEALAAISPSRPVQSLREATRGELLREGRTCYDHLAGRIGVELTRALVSDRILRRRDGSYVLTRRGERALSEVGVDVARARAQRRRFAFPCLDWSERREHLAGALGAAMTERLCALGWVARVGPGRAVAVTESGRAELRAWFGIDLSAPSERQSRR
jgi:DNA-binding transcriptional ArsR family regulator